MAYTLLGAPWNQCLDDNGAPLAGGKVYVYEAGLDTPTDSYSDHLGATPNSNPVILDAAGRPESGGIYLPTGGYKLVLTDDEDALIRTQDNVFVVNPA